MYSVLAKWKSPRGYRKSINFIDVNSIYLAAGTSRMLWRKIPWGLKWSESNANP